MNLLLVKDASHDFTLQNVFSCVCFAVYLAISGINEIFLFTFRSIAAYFFFLICTDTGCSYCSVMLLTFQCHKFYRLALKSILQISQEHFSNNVLRYFALKCILQHMPNDQKIVLGDE